MLKGISNGFWWSAVTMTTVGYGDKAPCALPGRLLGTVWMFSSIILISGFTAAIASSLTVARMGETVNGPMDLPHVTVASLANSTAAEYLADRGIRFSVEENLEAALNNLAEDHVDAVVYDRPMLQYLVSGRFSNQLAVLDAVVAQQNYALALPQGSQLREKINRLILANMQTKAYKNSLGRWLEAK